MTRIDPAARVAVRALRRFEALLARQRSLSTAGRGPRDSDWELATRVPGTRVTSATWLAARARGSRFSARDPSEHAVDRMDRTAIGGQSRGTGVGRQPMTSGTPGCRCAGLVPGPEGHDPHAAGTSRVLRVRDSRCPWALAAPGGPARRQAKVPEPRPTDQTTESHRLPSPCPSPTTRTGPERPRSRLGSPRTPGARGPGSGKTDPTLKRRVIVIRRRPPPSRSEALQVRSLAGSRSCGRSGPGSAPRREPCRLDGRLRRHPRTTRAGRGHGRKLTGPHDASASGPVSIGQPEHATGRRPAEASSRDVDGRNPGTTRSPMHINAL